MRSPRWSTEAAQPPDWRITCFFVHKDYRGQGVVESYPEDTTGREVQLRLLHNVSVWVVTKVVAWLVKIRQRPIGLRMVATQSSTDPYFRV